MLLLLHKILSIYVINVINCISTDSMRRMSSIGCSVLNDRRVSFKGNCELRRWESETLK